MKFVNTVANQCYFAAGIAAFWLLGLSLGYSAPQTGMELVFADDFDNAKSIDLLNQKGPGFKWYRQFFFEWPATTAGSNIVVANSILTLGRSGQGGGTLCTAVPFPNSQGWLGQAWRGGAYFEARIRFNPLHHFSSSGAAWPSFWSMSIEHLAGKGADQWLGQPLGYTHFIEVDFFEYTVRSARSNNMQYDGAVHVWFGMWKLGKGYMGIDNSGHGTAFNNSVNSVPRKTDFSQWHEYGCLWVPAAGHAEGYLQYYFDGTPTRDRVTWAGTPGGPPPSGASTFSIIDQHSLAIILSTGDNWPMEIDWVRVWQKPAGPEKSE